MKRGFSPLGYALVSEPRNSGVYHAAFFIYVPRTIDYFYLPFRAIRRPHCTPRNPSDSTITTTPAGNPA
jgi:hypothetical protein